MMSDDATNPAPHVPNARRLLAGRDRWSRTVVAGVVALCGLTVLGVTGILAGVLDSAGVSGLASIYAGIVTAIAGRSSTPGSST